MRETSLYALLHLPIIFTLCINFFLNGLNKSFGFGRLRGESGADGNQMDPMCKGLIPGLSFRQESKTVSDAGTRMGGCSSESLLKRNLLHGFGHWES